MITPTRPLEQALKDFDRASIRAHLEGAGASRKEILDRFPLAHWPQMTLEEYALGHDESEDAFCRWLEYRSPEIGSIKGGSARKHVIFKFKDGTWWHPSMFENEQLAWEHLRADFVKAFELAGQGEWNQIADLETLRWAPALSLKALHIYFPDEIIPIFSTSHLRHFLTALAAPQGEHHIESNLNLLAALRTIPELKGWSTGEMERLLYWWNDPRDTHRVRKVAPGEGAKWWDECLAGGYMCVGWDEIGDLAQFDSWKDVARRFPEVYPDKGKSNATTKAKELWMFRELEVGDIIVANHGKSKVLAIGEVQEPGYRWDPSREEAKNTVPVKWDTSYAGEISHQSRWGFVTVANVPAQLYKEILGLAKSGPRPGPEPAIPVEPLYMRIAGSLLRKKQVMLYGPPGTGKTYIALRFAVWWLNHRAGKADAGRILADEQEFARAEKALSTTQVRSRVWWIVASPKQWSWDRLPKDKSVEFRYGKLKRHYPLVQPGDLVVGYEGTPTKRVVALATVKRGLGEGAEGKPTIQLQPLSAVKNGPSYEALQDDPVLKDSEPLRNRCQGTLFSLTEDQADHILALIEETDPEAAEKAASLGEGPTGVGQLTRVTFHPSYAYEDFIEGFRPLESSDGDLILRLEDGLFKRVCRAAQADPKRPYLMLIDEFNRGNVAKVLGELITLLETDKRGLTITLPQSKETFAVPENVYILGTMNTADRSIKLLDAALRRRFAFIELMPDTELLSGAKVGDLDLATFLDALNERIAKTEGREKQIGHAYLLSGGQPVDDGEEFAALFREEILPLLQEYCYDEYQALASLIGPDLVKAEAQVLDLDILYDAERLMEALASHLISQGVDEA